MKYSEVKDSVTSVLDAVSQDLSDLKTDMDTYTDDNSPDYDAINDWLYRIQLFYTELQSVYTWLKQYFNTLP